MTTKINDSFIDELAKNRKTADDVVGNKQEVKASGAVRDFETAKAMIEAGVSSLGASSCIAIVAGTKSTSAY